ncbi:MAG: hypothetical protein JHC93_07965 [Parachlamydiales bacterium]|nr:hypothetical protein [Parachlamydiales bacterium]
MAAITNRQTDTTHTNMQQQTQSALLELMDRTGQIFQLNSYQNEVLQDSNSSLKAYIETERFSYKTEFNALKELHKVELEHLSTIYAQEIDGKNKELLKLKKMLQQKETIFNCCNELGQCPNDLKGVLIHDFKTDSAEEIANRCRAFYRGGFYNVVPPLE